MARHKALDDKIFVDQAQVDAQTHKPRTKLGAHIEPQQPSFNSKNDASKLPRADGQTQHVSHPKHLALGAGLEQSSMAWGTAASSAMDLADKMAGGKHEADQAKIAQKVDQLRAQIAQTVADSTKSGVDSALENYKAAQTLVQNYTQRWTEVNNNIANK